MEKGIKELLELINGLKALALVAKQVDSTEGTGLQKLLSALAALMGKQAELLAAIDGASQISDEVKNLTLDEAMEVVTALVNAAKEVKAAA